MLKIINPYNGELIKEIESDTKYTINEKWGKAKGYLEEWKNTPYEKKKESIIRFKKLLENNLEDLARTLTSEVGKPIQQSKNEIRATIPRIDYFLKKVPEFLSRKKIHKEKNLREEITYEPLGAIANISAWNYPYFVGSNVFIPALLTGNIVFYKPSEYATLTGLSISEFLKESGIPETSFIPIIGEGQVGSLLLELPLNGVFFTGSYTTGMKIAASVAGRMKVQLELGGKDPVYVCEDVDIKKAVASISDGAFYNTGQSCCSVERIYVNEKIYKEFTNSFLEVVKSFKMGNPEDENTYIGPLARKQQLEFLSDQIKDAREKGANVLLGGESVDKEKNFFYPSILINVSHKMKIMSEESFGPVIGIQKVKDDEEAILEMNRTLYGLTAGVYTKDEQRAIRILEKINSGSVYWNCCDRVSPNLPWSGRNRSGLGVTLSLPGIETFMQPKAWHLRKL